MFWPIALPFQITVVLLSLMVLVFTVRARSKTGNRPVTFLIASLMACVALIPSCIGVMYVVDAVRFGVFHYEKAAQVYDVRVERYLPPAASDVTVEKYASGHRAQYHISETELLAYLDDEWKRHGKLSMSKREDMLGEGKAANRVEMDREFQSLGWEPLNNAIQYHSPYGANGAGATYYYDRNSGIAYHRAAYW